MSNKTDIMNFPMKKKREPKIIVFNEPKFVKNNDKQDGNPDTMKNRKRKMEEEPEGDEEDFLSVAREVKEFGITGFTMKEQKKNRQKYAEHLGAHKQKSEKVPYPVLMERIKQKKIKDQKQKELEVAMGIFKKTKKEDEVKVTQKYNLGRWVDKSRIDTVKTSKKGSMRRVNKSEITRIQNRKT